MHFFPIRQLHPFLVPIQVWYESAFPANERRHFDELIRLLPRTDMHLSGLLVNDQLVGFMIYWQWPDCVFVEHFAIDPSQRGQGYGEQAIKQLLHLDTPTFLLEVELPQDELSRRRIHFYERQGFSRNAFNYTQPPYRRDDSPVPMLLMSSSVISIANDFRRFSNLIRERVYEQFY